jgi:endosialidase-like protein
MKTTIRLFLTFFCLSMIGPTSQAVTPAPDGGYPGGNTAEGQNALFSRTTGGYNTAVGYFSLLSDTTNNFNTALGAGALLANTADLNTATGAGALLSNTIGAQNTAIGALALVRNTTGVQNTAVGEEALWNNTTGNTNVAVGWGTLFANTAGSDNTVVGYEALDFSTSDGNVAIGTGAGGAITTAGNVICIGSNVIGANISNTCFIGNIRGVTTGQNDAVPVLIDSFGQLGTMSSSRRYKTDIKRIDKVSESILELKPVSFRYKIHKGDTPQFGLIAEEVAEVNPDLVIYGRDGKPYTVRYDAVNAMLLNEFLKEHKMVQEQGATITELKTQIQALTAGLQKVTAQLEVSKPSAQTVQNSR